MSRIKKAAAERLSELRVAIKDGKAGAWIYTMLILILFALPTVLMPFASKGSAPQLPSLVTEQENKALNTAFPEEFDEYFSENFALRDEMITADALLQYGVFRQSSSDKVVAGRNGWLYFAETTDDYTGESALSDRGIFCMQKTLELMNEYLEQNGITMVYVVAPNKNSIYPEYMPRSILASSQPSNLERLSKRMTESEYYVDVQSVLREYKKNSKADIYHKTDSHWNNIGAMKVYEAIESNIAARSKGFVPMGYSHDVKGSVPFDGDLSAMLFPSFTVPDVRYDMGIAKEYTTERPLTDPMAQEIITASESQNGSAICYRDSFFNALIDPIANAFSKTCMTRAVPYDLTGAVEYDIAIIEIAERNMHTLLESTPIMPAPSRSIAKTVEESGAVQQCSVTRTQNGYVIEGSVGEWTDVDTDECIYVELQSADGSSLFEAFPTVQGEASAEYGFSLLIASEQVPQSVTAAYLHIGNAEKTRRAKLVSVNNSVIIN